MNIERYILGACFHSHAVVDILQSVSVDDFSAKEDQQLFAVIEKLVASGIDPDLPTIAAADKTLSASYIAEIEMECVAVGNLGYMLNQFRDHADRLRFMRMGNFLMRDQGQTATELRVEIERALETKIDSKTEHVSKPLKRALAQMENAYNNRGKITGIPTGITKIDDELSGLHKTDMILIAARPSLGKELTLNSKVLLHNGTFIKMGDIMVGDAVASIDGKKSKVAGVYPQGRKHVYKITFSDGRTVKAGLKHQWEVMYRDWDSPRVLTTEELIEKLEYKRYKNRLYIPYPSGDFGQDKDIFVHPYMLGVLLGDGGLSGSTIKLTTSYEHIIEKIKPMLLDAELRRDQKITYRIATNRGSENRLLDAVKALGLSGKRSHEKHIPKQYLSATRESRLDLMRGLIDTDGTVGKDGAMTYTTTSKLLADDFQSLARSLGAYASMSNRITQYKHKGEKKNGRRSYTIFISCKNYGDFVTIPHKKERIIPGKRNMNLNISKIEYYGEEECQCISVNHPRSLYLTDEYIVTHNTALALQIADSACINGGEPTLFISLEMSSEQLSSRLLLSRSKINVSKSRNGLFDEADWSRMTNSAGKMNDAPFYVDDCAGITMDQLMAKAKAAKMKHNIGMLIIDYLGLIGGSGTEYERVSDASRKTKILAKQLNIPIVAVHQLNRGGEKDGKTRRPTMSDLRGTGQLEQDADVIILLHREKKDPIEPCELIIEKNRHGKTGTIPQQWNGPINRVESMPWSANNEKYY